MKINILNLIEIKVKTKNDPILPDGDIYVDQGDGGKFRWFIYHGEDYKGHSGALGFDSEADAWSQARLLMRGYKLRRGRPKP